MQKIYLPDPNDYIIIPKELENLFLVKRIKEHLKKSKNLKYINKN